MSWMMPVSPAGRNIQPLEGEPVTIINRGQAIEDLGKKMGTSAAFLKKLADEADGQSGKAIEKLREIVGDTHEELKKAGDMYRPTGPILISYGTALSCAQPRVDSAVTTCESRWNTYQATPGYLAGDRPFWARPDPDSDEAKDAQDDDRSKQRAYDDFIDAARGFDREVDTWEDAFDTAANGIGDVLEGSIKDGFWDNVDGFIANVMVVLKWAGIILAIATIIIGGPILGLLSGIVAVLTLAFTIYQFIRSDAGGMDLGLAIIGVIPFGSMGKLFKGKVADFAGDMFMAFKPSSWSKAFAEGSTLASAFREGGGFLKGLWSGTKSLFSSNNPMGPGDMMTRFLFGKDTTSFTELVEGMLKNGTKLESIWEFSFRMLSGPWKALDKIATWTGNDGQKPSSVFPWIGAFLK